MCRSLWLLAVLVMALTTVSIGAGVSRSETVRVTVNEDYAASPMYRYVFGNGYRDLWTTPIEVERLELESAGLQVVEQVGSMQTLGLALKGKDGRSYTFRSLDKDASRLLPDWMRLPPWPSIFKDQTAANFPAAPLVTARFAEAIGLLSPPIRLVVLGDDPALGEFRETFAGLVGTLQEYPTAGATGPGTFGATEIVSTAELFERFEAMGLDRPDPRAYLRTRLMDLWIGDWDRHAEQTRWAKIPGAEFWQPLPEDRDGAFAHYEGVTFRLVDIDRLVQFEDEYPNDPGLFVQARQLDEWVLAAVDRAAWEAEIEFVVGRIGDAVIDQAIGRLPDAWKAQRGDQLKDRLVARRGGLRDEALRMYSRLAQQVRWIGSSRTESWRAQCGDEGRLALQYWDPSARAPTLSRVFRPEETESVQIWTSGGADTEAIVDRQRCRVGLEIHRESESDRFPGLRGGLPHWE